MERTGDTDYATLMGVVARKLLGEPTSTPCAASWSK